MKTPADVITKYVATYKELKVKMEQADALLLTLLEHPDATDEMILTSVKTRRAHKAFFEKTEADLIKLLVQHRQYSTLRALSTKYYKW